MTETLRCRTCFGTKKRKDNKPCSCSQLCKKCGSFDRDLSGHCRLCKRNSRLKKIGVICQKCNKCDRDQSGRCNWCAKQLYHNSVPCSTCGSCDRYPNSKCKVCERVRRANNWSQELILSARATSKRRGHSPPTINEQWVQDQFQSSSRCPYTGIEIIPANVSNQLRCPWQPSLDRIDNSITYTPENTKLTSWFWNCYRNTLPIDVALENFRGVVRAILAIDKENQT